MVHFLEDSLDLLTNAYRYYQSPDDTIRRLSNLAFYEKIRGKQDSDTVEGAPGTPFKVLFNPDVYTLPWTTGPKGAIGGFKPKTLPV